MKLFLAFFILFLFPGCKAPTRKEVEAYVFQNNGPIPSSLCGKKPTGSYSSRPPSVWDYGFYRRLNNGKMEFVSFCASNSNRWLSIHERDLNRMIDAYVPDSHK